MRPRLRRSHWRLRSTSGAGHDLEHLFAGAEDTLDIVTCAAIHLDAVTPVRLADVAMTEPDAVRNNFD